MRYDIQKRYRDNKKKQGKCYYCNRDAENNSTRCKYHLMKQREQQQRLRDKSRVKRQNENTTAR